jgi:expansin (peptidoglycan-binding protein)
LTSAAGGTFNTGAFKKIDSGAVSLSCTATSGSALITFNTMFTGIPTVVVTYATGAATMLDVTPITIVSGTTTPTQATISARKLSSGTATVAVNWIAVGV